jgi:hypothetical protein
MTISGCSARIPARRDPHHSAENVAVFRPAERLQVFFCRGSQQKKA